MAKFKIENHNLVPKHSKLSKDETEELCKRYRITVKDLPRIHHKDAAIAAMNVKENDVVKIERKSPTAGLSVFYRRVSRD
ncbi:MAG: DNA-directed RNA polymerase subunit H [Nanoarchaeota archaeon]